ncbi:flagellar motor protein MotS [Pontibacillus salicampi]|uniref:Flagellar motor protein MotS n=1 Tax=Pontibacillus salicampi TaxID=1449801 RepID=A0ABV6LIT1_9BACI
MKLRKRSERVEKGAPKWMVTFSDMMTLILVFFILLFSMSQIDLVKFKAVAESFKSRAIFDFYPSVVEFENPSEEKNQPLEQKDKSDFESPDSNSIQQAQQGSTDNDESLDQLVQEVQTFLEENKLQNVISANRTERGVVLSLQEQVLFESAQAEIIQEGKPFLNKVGTLLKNIPNHVKVEGHTDNRPISTFRYPSNWELSSARASSVLRFLTTSQNLDGSRFAAVGYGDTRPIAPNDSESNWKKNRRVEIVILNPNYDNSSKPSTES